MIQDLNMNEIKNKDFIFLYCTIDCKETVILIFRISTQNYFCTVSFILIKKLKVNNVSLNFILKLIFLILPEEIII